MKVTIYLQDDLAAKVKAELGDANISAICQGALRDELERVEARAKITAEGFERIERYELTQDAEVAFQGREIGQDQRGDVTAWLTPRDNIALYDSRNERLWVVADFDEIRNGDWPPDLLAQIAAALGEKYVLELDI